MLKYLFNIDHLDFRESLDLLDYILLIILRFLLLDFVNFYEHKDCNIPSFPKWQFFQCTQLKILFAALIIKLQLTLLAMN